MEKTKEIQIYDIEGKELMLVPVLPECERVEELMASDYAQLQWNSDTNTALPVGANITWEGETLFLLDPYTPEQVNELEWCYKPQFQSSIMVWNRIPFFYYFSTNGDKEQNPEWTFSGSAIQFMELVCRAISLETGESWTYEVETSLSESKTIEFGNIDIYSALNEIASNYETEWRADKVRKVVHLGKALHSIDSRVSLTVGENINPPTVNANSESYYEQFYIYGSTRNITQDYQGATTNSLSKKRLTLDPALYPESLLPPNENGKHTLGLRKRLIFDEVYPHSELTISNVRMRLMYRIDGDGKKVEIGTTKDPETGDQIPVYDQYAIWGFRINGFTLNPTTYNKDDNPDGMYLPDLNLSVHFKSGTLMGREFELKYWDKDSTSSDIGTDGVPWQWKKGDYEILFTEESGYVIPDTNALIPKDGDKIALFNIRMPEAYVNAAQKELYQTAIKTINERYTSDLNNYECQSNPVAFEENDPKLTIGQAVRYSNGGYTLDTRVIKIVRKMDYDCEQTITIGNEKVKGNFESIKEDVVLANKNIDLLATLNNLTANTATAFDRTQQLMLAGFERIGKMWQFDEDGNIYTPYNAYSLEGIAAKGVSTSTGGSGAMDEALLGAYLTEHDYVTKQWVLSQNFSGSVDLSDYTKLSDFNSHVNNTIVHITSTERTKWNKIANDFTAITGTDSDTIINKWEEVVAFLATYTEADTLAGLLANKVDKVSGMGLSTNDFTDALLTKLNSLSDYTLPTASTTVKGGIKVGNGLTVTNDILSVNLSSLHPSISNIDGLQKALDDKLNKSVWDSVFEIDSDGNLHAKVGIYSDKYISVNGVQSGDSSTLVGIDADWLIANDYAKFSEIKSWVQAQNFSGTIDLSGYALKSELSNYALKSELSGYALKSELASYVLKSDLSDYALRSELSSYALKSWVTGNFQPIGSYVGIASNGVMEAGRYLDFHSSNFGNNKTEDYTVRLDGGGAASGRVFKFPSTGGTLATESWVSGSLSDYVTLNTAQEITGRKTFASGTWFLKGNESNDITTRYMANDTIGLGSSISLNAIRNGIDFQWFDTHWVIGNIRSNNVSTRGFGIGMLNTAGKLDLGLRVTTSAIHAQGFKKVDGTSTQVLMADGSIQNHYLSADIAYATSDDGMITPLAMNTWTSNTFLKLSGGTMSNTNLVTNLNADMVDGVHADSLFGFSESTWNDGETVGDYAKRALTGKPCLASMRDWSWVNSGYLTLGSYSIDRMRYSALHFRRGNLNNMWCQNAVMFLPSYRDSSMIYIAQMFTESTVGVVNTSVKRYADYDTIINGNVYSATKLQTPRTLWGQNFDGTGNVSGSLSGVGDITASGTIYTDGSLYAGSDIHTLGQVRADSGIKLGEGLIYWDTVNKCVRVSKGLIADEFLAAMGNLQNTTYQTDERIIVELKLPNDNFDGTEHSFLSVIKSINGITNKKDTVFLNLFQRILAVVYTAPNFKDVREASRIMLYAEIESDYLSYCFTFSGGDSDGWMIFTTKILNKTIYLYEVERDRDTKEFKDCTIGL
ncbi:MAG: hypothetical protein NC548_31820 [Lachnospiraceae bacterium]|nr:hypothetical protein [Lachnospiraceae bacterium]